MLYQPKKEFYSWSRYQKDIGILTEKLTLRPEYTFENIYGIPRGGLVVAVSLSHSLNLKLVEFSGITSKTLIVDDIIDSGETIQRILGRLEDADIFSLKVASLYYNPDSQYKPDEYIRIKRRWVVFPWEREETSKYDGTVTNNLV